MVSEVVQVNIFGYQLLKRRKAVSPLLATIILIAITVVASLAVYSLFFSTVGTMSSTLQVDIVSCDLVKAASPSKVLFSITVKNTGNKPITSCNVSIWDDSGTEKPATGGKEILTATLNPGAFASYSFTDVNIGTGFTVGKSYPVKIKAGDGTSTFEKTIIVYCLG
jgi:flagellin-like protein